MFIDDDDDRNLDVEWVKWVYYFRCHLDPNEWCVRRGKGNDEDK